MKTFETWFNNLPSTDSGEFLAYAESSLREAWNAAQLDLKEEQDMELQVCGEKMDELIDRLRHLQEENDKLNKILRRIADCDWCKYSDTEEFDMPCLKCKAGSKFIADITKVEK